MQLLTFVYHGTHRLGLRLPHGVADVAKSTTVFQDALSDVQPDAGYPAVAEWRTAPELQHVRQGLFGGSTRQLHQPVLPVTTGRCHFDGHAGGAFWAWPRKSGCSAATR
jgi:hypothetical protein